MNPNITKGCLIGANLTRKNCFISNLIQQKRIVINPAKGNRK